MTTSKTVLVIDDNADLVEALQLCLRREGYDVLTATDGQAGTELAGWSRPDLVVVDMLMPLKSGFAVLEAVKAGPNPVPVVMISANGAEAHRAYAAILGADDFVAKPFSFDRLLKSVRRLCPCEPATRVPAVAG